MAMIKRDQLQYSGRGPLDSKALVKEYAMLLDVSTWTTTVEGTDMFTAYNGMIVSVWLNKTDTSKNGVYFLYDPQVTTPVKKPDVTNEANWHRIINPANASEEIARITAAEKDIADLKASLQSMNSDVAAVKSDIEDLQDVQAESFAKYEDFPREGIANKIYIAIDTKKSYTWVENVGYICISGDTSSLEDINLIYGGSASHLTE